MKLEDYDFAGDPISQQEFERIKKMSGLIEHDTKKLQTLAIAADKIAREELEKSDIKFDFLEVRVIDRKTVGVQGDDRTYKHPVMVNIMYENRFVWDQNF